MDYNLNVNKDVQSPLEYKAERPNATYIPSPQNWRELPVYMIVMDKFADGDLQGVRVIFVSGTPFINMLWQADSYSALDFTIHAHGMYFMADFTVGTIGDLLGFKGYLNTSTPFDLNGYETVYKNAKYMPWNFAEYCDFEVGFFFPCCKMPAFWLDDGSVINFKTNGCFNSDFDQYGDMEAFDVHPNRQRQLSKFASVQDRLHEWKPSVMAKLKVFSCMAIKALHNDAIHIDKATQVTVDTLTKWASSTCSCAKDLGKNNFFIPGAVTGGDRFGSLY
ncbi:glycoside hydrolase [Flagelloscypha sp. PMI_526]|nr:glycoside hydrolase [Flagelloscypha sp. PMI_526]